VEAGLTDHVWSDCRTDASQRKIAAYFLAGDEMGTKNATDERLHWHEKIGYAVIVAALCLFGILFSFVFLVLPRTQDVDSSITKALLPVNERLATMSATLELLKPHAKNTLPEIMKENLASQKNGNLGLKTVAALATQAREQNIAADPKQIATVGDQLTSSPELLKKKNNTDAWNALTGLLSYYTSLNALPMGLRPLPFGAPQYDFGGTNGVMELGQISYTGGLVPIDQAAVGEHIINPARNPDIKEAPQTVVFKANSQDEIAILDGHHLRNVVLINMTVYYGGGPVILENVSFVNCIFKLAQQDKCVSFGRSLFASNPITFHSTG
jgi:hypothetical protein